MNSNIVRGVAAGFAATIVLTAIMVAKAVFRFMPELNLASLLSGILGAEVWVGWIVHFVIGTFVWGALFGILVTRTPGSTCTIRGMIFGVGAWLLMQLLILPLAGLGLFGMAYGLGAPAVTFVLHLIYGAVLGATFALQKGTWRVKGPEDDAHGALRYTHY